MMRSALAVAILAGLVGAWGCGGPEPDKPASLTSQQEQEILDQVQGAVQQESGQPR